MKIVHKDIFTLNNNKSFSMAPNLVRMHWWCLQKTQKDCNIVYKQVKTPSFVILAMQNAFIPIKIRKDGYLDNRYN